MKDFLLFSVIFSSALHLYVDGTVHLSNEEIRSISPQGRPSCQPGAKPAAIQIDTSQRLSDLRNHFISVGIKGYIIPSVDAHLSEYVADYDKRRQFISGFSGSQGTAVVLENKAALWTDGRYFLQAEDQMDCNWILMKSAYGSDTVPSITEWIIANLEMGGGSVGAYPFLLGGGDWLFKTELLEEHGIQLVRVEDELVDKIWTTGRPPIPRSKIHSMMFKFTGKTWENKVTDVQEEMAEKNVDALVITSLDEVAWLTNCRASDVPYNPVFMSYVIIDRPTNTTKLYIRDISRKLSAEFDPEISDKSLQNHLNTGSDGNCGTRPNPNRMCIEVHDYDAILDSVRELNATADKIWLSYSCSYAIYGLINKDKMYQANTPIALMKSVKNSVEQVGLRNSHIRDGVALIKFIAKLEKEVQEGKHWTELSAAEQAAKFRGEQKYNRGLSFESISSSGFHGAVIHYSPTNKTDKRITTSEMYLLDSGGQYIDGTTDVTRTFHFGTPTDFEKECYTLVLKGQIGLTNSVFTNGLKGRLIDFSARLPLWKRGLQYRHGTGHGIGSYLNVHEGPGSISITGRDSSVDQPLQENMFFSVEPGYYEDGKFGVRHENIAHIVEAETKYHFPGYKFLTFDTVTMVPYEPHMIDYSLLTEEELEWLNDYHHKVQDTIGPLIQDDPQASQWLKKRTGHVDIASDGTQLTYSFTMCFLLIFTLCIY